jgi:tRNA (guanine37-N1)-methyltransferase
VSGYVSNEDSLQEESFGEGNYEHLLEYPHYTKPLVWKSDKVPEILISGDHKKIFEWRLNQAKKNTKNRRPDLWTKYLNGVKK